MGILDGALGGVVGAEMASVIGGLIEKRGGVQGVVSQLQEDPLERERDFTCRQQSAAEDEDM